MRLERKVIKIHTKIETNLVLTDNDAQRQPLQLWILKINFHPCEGHFADERTFEEINCSEWNRLNSKKSDSPGEETLNRFRGSGKMVLGEDAERVGEQLFTLGHKIGC